MQEKVFLVTNIPNPYRIPLFNELSNQLEKEGIKFKVIFGALSRSGRKWVIEMSECRFNYEVLDSKKITLVNPEKVLFTYKGLLSLVAKERPNFVIVPGFSIATLKIWLWSWLFSCRYIIWTGSIVKKGRNDSYLRKIQRKILVKKASGFIAYGSKTREYLLSLGAARDKISIAVNTVDVKFFVKEVENLNRNSLTSDDKKHLLYIGHLSPRKNVLNVLQVIKRLSSKRSDFILDIVGDGQERVILEKFVQNNDLKDFVIFHGFKQKSELPQYLAKTCCFLFQTDFDIWGLVLNEAMAAGLPCIASVNAGATHDLIIDGITGFAMDFREIEKVALKIDWILNNPELANEIGKKARDFILENANLEKSSLGFVKAIRLI